MITFQAVLRFWDVQLLLCGGGDSDGWGRGYSMALRPRIINDLFNVHLFSEGFAPFTFLLSIVHSGDLNPRRSLQTRAEFFMQKIPRVLVNAGVTVWPLATFGLCTLTQRFTGGAFSLPTCRPHTRPDPGRAIRPNPQRLGGRGLNCKLAANHHSSSSVRRYFTAPDGVRASLIMNIEHIRCLPPTSGCLCWTSPILFFPLLTSQIQVCCGCFF